MSDLREKVAKELAKADDCDSEWEDWSEDSREMYRQIADRILALFDEKRRALEDELVAERLLTAKWHQRCGVLKEALKPFADDDECGVGLHVGESEEHTERCYECSRIMAARAALGKDE